MDGERVAGQHRLVAVAPVVPAAVPVGHPGWDRRRACPRSLGVEGLVRSTACSQAGLLVVSFGRTHMMLPSWKVWAFGAAMGTTALRHRLVRRRRAGDGQLGVADGPVARQLDELPVDGRSAPATGRAMSSLLTGVGWSRLVTSRICRLRSEKATILSAQPATGRPARWTPAGRRSRAA